MFDTERFINNLKYICLKKLNVTIIILNIAIQYKTGPGTVIYIKRRRYVIKYNLIKINNRTTAHKRINKINWLAFTFWNNLLNTLLVIY